MFLRRHGWSVRLVAAVMQAAASPHRDEVIAVSGDVRWTMVAADPKSDRLMFGVLTGDNEIWLTSWSGTFWLNGPIVTTIAAKDIAPTVAVAFEGLSGRALATWSDADDVCAIGSGPRECGPANSSGPTSAIGPTR